MNTLVSSVFLSLVCSLALFGKEVQKEEKELIAELVAQDGAKIRVTVISLEGSMYDLTGENFKPNESVTCISASGKEVLCYEAKATAKGQLYIGLSPAVIGKSGGMAYYHILREGGPIHLKYYWGTESDKSLQSSGKKHF